MRGLVLTAVELLGLVLLLGGAFAYAIPVGIAVAGLALLAVGWALDKE